MIRLGLLLLVRIAPLLRYALHLTPIFLGIIVIALVGTVSDLFSAVWFAR